MSESSEGSRNNKSNSESDKKSSTSQKNKGKSKSTKFNYQHQLTATQLSDDDEEDEDNDKEQQHKMENTHLSQMTYYYLQRPEYANSRPFQVLSTSAMSKRHNRTSPLNRVRGPTGIKKQKSQRTTYRSTSLDEINDLGYIHEFRLSQSGIGYFSLPPTAYGSSDAGPVQGKYVYSVLPSIPSSQYAPTYSQPSLTPVASPQYMPMATAQLQHQHYQQYSQHQQQHQDQDQQHHQPSQQEQPVQQHVQYEKSTPSSFPVSSNTHSRRQSLSQSSQDVIVSPAPSDPSDPSAPPALPASCSTQKPVVVDHNIQKAEPSRNSSHSKTNSEEITSLSTQHPPPDVINPQPTSLSASPTHGFQSSQLSQPSSSSSSSSNNTNSNAVEVIPSVPNTASTNIEGSTKKIHNSQPEQNFYQPQTQQLDDPSSTDVPGDRSKEETDKFGDYTYQQTPSGTNSNLYSAATIDLTQLSWDNALQLDLADLGLSIQTPIPTTSSPSMSSIFQDQESININEIPLQSSQNVQQQQGSSSSDQSAPQPQQVQPQQQTYATQNLSYIPTNSSTSTMIPFQVDPYHQTIPQLTPEQNTVLQTNTQLQQQQQQQQHQQLQQQLQQQQLQQLQQQQLQQLQLQLQQQQYYRSTDVAGFQQPLVQPQIQPLAQQSQQPQQQTSPLIQQIPQKKVVFVSRQPFHSSYLPQLHLQQIQDRCNTRPKASSSSSSAPSSVLSSFSAPSGSTPVSSSASSMPQATNPIKVRRKKLHNRTPNVSTNISTSYNTPHNPLPDTG